MNAAETAVLDIRAIVTSHQSVAAAARQAGYEQGKRDAEARADEDYAEAMKVLSDMFEDLEARYGLTRQKLLDDDYMNGPMWSADKLLRLHRLEAK